MVQEQGRLRRVMRYYEYLRYFGPRFVQSLVWNRRRKTAVVFGRTVHYISESWFLHSLKDIFVDGVYLFDSEKASPYIVDCGSNIGLSIIFFKRLFPRATIVGFEPDPWNFEILQKNLRAFSLTDVELVNKALWSEPGTVRFLAKGGVGSRIIRGEAIEQQQIVPTAPLGDFLKGRDVDFLKVDIEGAEYAVLQSCREYLPNVRNLFVEYHGARGEAQLLPELTAMLRDAGFRYYVREAWENYTHPYVRRNTPVYDLQVNIFAYRLEGSRQS